MLSFLRVGFVTTRGNLSTAVHSLRNMATTFYELKANDIDGKEVDFSKYKGKVVLIENVASH